MLLLLLLPGAAFITVGVTLFWWDYSHAVPWQGGYVQGQGQGMFSQGPQAGLSSQNGSSFNSMTAGTAGTPPLGQASPQWSGTQGGGQQQGLPQQTPPRGPTRKEAAAVHDPFAALTGGRF